MPPFDFLSKFFGSKRLPRDASPQPSTAVPIETVSKQPEWDDRHFEETCRQRDRFWQSVGIVENDVLTHLISPGLTGGPDWPTTRQAYRVIRRNSTLIIATDGLADPFDGVSGSGNGFEIEIFIETPDIDAAHAGAPGDIGRIKESWAFELVQNLAGTIANAGGINHQLDRYSVLSVEIPGVSQSHAVATQVPKRFITEDDCIGILIGAPRPDFVSEITDMPLSPVKIAPIVLITAAELEHVRAGDAETRTALAEALSKSAAGHVSRFERQDVL